MKDLKELFLKHNCKSKESFNSNFTSMFIIDNKTDGIEDINFEAEKYYIINKIFFGRYSEVVIVFDVELKALNINYKFKKVHQKVNKDIIRIIFHTSYDFTKSARKSKYIEGEFRIKERIAVL